MWLLATIVFVIVNVLPGDVGRQVLGPTASQETVDQYNERLGTDKPLGEQYVTSLKNLVTLDFGKSYSTGRRRHRPKSAVRCSARRSWPLLALDPHRAVRDHRRRLRRARARTSVADRSIVMAGLASRRRCPSSSPRRFC